MPASEYRHMRTGSLNIQSNGNGAGHGHGHGVANGTTMNGMQQSRFDGPRSPPNTSHVPCKFFRQGACQAGTACPFSHDIGNAAENVCKYFAKGNCKFGPKCANVHVLPDGRRINYSKNGVTIGGTAITLGTRVNPNAYNHQHASNLTNSFMRGSLGGPAVSSPDGPNNNYAVTNPYTLDDRYVQQQMQLGRMENGVPTIDTTYSSNPASAYGSPRDEDASNRFGLALSPVSKGLSVLDAPLPASFDSNGISHAARYGPWPSSVPSKFGLESPSPSLNSARDGRTSDALKMLHNSAFGGSEHLSPSALGSGSISGAEDSSSLLFNGKQQRTLHSSSLRYAKPRLLSSSAPKIDRDWETEFLFEEDYVPGTLANEVLTPAEKARRGSTNTLRADQGSETGEVPPSSSSAAVPMATTKFGSPIGAASPSSRWGPLFQRQKEEEGLSSPENGSLNGSSRKHGPSAFGHVGSPLRNSSLASNMGDLNGLNGRLNSPGSKTVVGAGGESMSVLTQQLRRTQLGDDSPSNQATSSASSSPHLHPSTAQAPMSGGTGGLRALGVGIIGKDRDRERGLERHISSGSIGSSVTGRFTTPIDEEDPAFVFSMEEDEEASRARKRISGGHMGASSPLSAAWSYAAVAGNGAGSGAVNGKGGRDGGVVESVAGR